MENDKRRKAAKILAIVALASVFSAILLAVIFDIIAFREVILQFIASLVLPVFAFIFLFIAMIASFVFIFGIYLIKEYGFWPLTLSIDFFKELLNDIKITEEAIKTFMIFRIILMVICIVIISLTIISKSLCTEQKEENSDSGKKASRRKGINSMATISMIFGILGLVVSASALALVCQI